MKKYFNVYLLLLKLNLSNMFAYRANLLNSSIASVGWGIVSISAILLLTSKTSSVFGWTRGELLLLVGIYNILNGCFVVFFSRNFEKFAYIIDYAQLDTMLLKPIDSQFQLSLSLVNITGSIRIILGFLFCWYILSILPVNLTIFTVLIFLTFLVFSMIIFYCMWFLVMTLVIWFRNLSNLMNFLYIFNNLGRYPPQIITSLRNIFLFIFLPFTFIASVPAKELLASLTLQDILVFISTALGLLLLSRKFYQFALRYYTSASS